MSSGPFKEVTYKLIFFKSYMYIIDMYKEDLPSNNLRKLIC